MIRSFTAYHHAPDGKNVDRTVQEATQKANEWIDEVSDRGLEVKIISTSTQLVVEGNYATYVITLTIELHDEIA